MTSKFPVVQSILEGSEMGSVFSLGNDTFFCFHKGGFGQILGSECNIAEVWFSMIHENNLPRYFHLYDVSEPLLIEIFRIKAEWNLLIRNRVKWIHSSSVAYGNLPAEYVMIEGANISLEQYGKLPQEMISKFYYTIDLFKAKSMAKVIFDRNNNEFCSICYAAAWGGDTAEIDVYSNEKYRGLGLAEIVVNEFVNGVKDSGRVASWDCFLDNKGSLALAKKCGFSVLYEYRMLSVFIL